MRKLGSYGPGTELQRETLVVQRPICVLDANAVIGDRRLRGPAATALLRALDRGEVDVALPEVALEEIISNFRHELTAAARAIREAQKALGKLGILWDNNINVDEATADYRQWLTELFRERSIVVLPTPAVDHAVLVARDIAKRKPFKSDGTGYRDALIWHTVLQASKDRPVLFVSANSADFAESRKNRDTLASVLRDDVLAASGDEASVRLVPRITDLIEIMSGAAPDIVESLNRAFESKRLVRDLLISKLRPAILESPVYGIEVDGIPGPMVEVLQEQVHEPIRVNVEAATQTESDLYLLDLYVEADVDIHVTWTLFGTDFDDFEGEHYTSASTSATLWYSVDASFDRANSAFNDVRVYGSAHGTVLLN